MILSTDYQVECFSVLPVDSFFRIFWLKKQENNKCADDVGSVECSQ